MTDQLLFETKDHIATITLNRPDVLNAFTEEMIEAWVAALQECRDNDDIHVVVLTGAGRAFCAGGDVRAMKESPDRNNPNLTKSRLWDMVQNIPKTLQEMDKPIIAAVNGAATGAGMDMASMCDIRVAAESAKFAESYVRMGLVPGAGGCWFLPRLVGMPKALELLYTADFVEAAEAKEIGLVNHVYPDDELMEQTYKLATKIARRAPISVRLIKRATYQGQRIDLVTHLDQISSHMTIARSSDDHMEAVDAFLEKRHPVFKGK
jgi:2-(1,2-epoxy-1,2-dihydrophenyl)acetyl-CoA isomerase